VVNGAVVDPGTFQEFYKCWKQNEVHIRQVASLNDFIDTSVDVVIKVSQLINCSVGTGHIVLTHNRQVAFFFFLPPLLACSRQSLYSVSKKNQPYAFHDKIAKSRPI